MSDRIKVEVELDHDQYESMELFLSILNKTKEVIDGDFVLDIQGVLELGFYVLVGHKETLGYGFRAFMRGDAIEFKLSVASKEHQSTGGDRVKELEQELAAIKSLLAGGKDVHPLAAELPSPTKGEIQRLFQELAA